MGALGAAACSQKWVLSTRCVRRPARDRIPTRARRCGLLEPVSVHLDQLPVDQQVFRLPIICVDNDRNFHRKLGAARRSSLPVFQP